MQVVDTVQVHILNMPAEEGLQAVPKSGAGFLRTAVTCRARLVLSPLSTSSLSMQLNQSVMPSDRSHASICAKNKTILEYYAHDT